MKVLSRYLSFYDLGTLACPIILPSDLARLSGGTEQISFHGELSVVTDGLEPGTSGEDA